MKNNNKKLFFIAGLFLLFSITTRALPAGGERGLPYGIEIKNEDPSVSKLLIIIFDKEEPLLVKIGPKAIISFLQMDATGKSIAQNVFFVKYGGQGATTSTANATFAKIRVEGGNMSGVVEDADVIQIKKEEKLRDTSMALRVNVNSTVFLRSFRNVEIRFSDEWDEK